MKASLRELKIQHVIAYVLLFAGVALLFWGFDVDPKGKIDYSVLTAFGEISVFVGALLGIDYNYRKYVYDYTNKDKKDE